MQRNFDFNCVLGTRVRKRRRELGLSQTELAKQLHTTQSAISLYEAGSRAITAQGLVDIAHALDVSPASLLEDEETGAR